MNIYPVGRENKNTATLYASVFILVVLKLTDVLV